MNTKQKQLVGLGLLAVAGYLVYENMKKKPAAAAPAATAATTPAASFAGDIAGKRVKLVGASGEPIAKAKEKLFVGANGWVKADAVPEGGKFFAVKDSGFK